MKSIESMAPKRLDDRADGIRLSCPSRGQPVRLWVDEHSSPASEFGNRSRVGALGHESEMDSRSIKKNPEMSTFVHALQRSFKFFRAVGIDRGIKKKKK